MSAKIVERMIIPRAGISQGTSRPRGLYGPLIDRVATALGDKDINRASHVDSINDLTGPARDWLAKNCKGLAKPAGKETDIPVFDKNKWFADLLPVAGPVLGPFNTRKEGLAAEHEWIHKHNVPVPGQAPAAAG